MEAMAIIREDGVEKTKGMTDTVPWWSFTKTVLSIALVRLSEQGRCDLDQPVGDQSYTPAQLLRHQAGLPDYGSLPRYHDDVQAGRQPWSIDDLLQRAGADRLQYQPGHGWAYSNIGYWKVARLIEEASDRPLADALADLVFIPAALPTARLAVLPADLANVQMGDAISYHPGWVYHGLVVGTVMDAARLLRRLLQNRLVASESLAKMLDGQSLPRFRSVLHPDPAYGLGLMVAATAPSDERIGHSGSGPGSRIAVYARHGITCAVWAAETSIVDPETAVFDALQNGTF